MAEDWTTRINSGVPNPARIYDYFLGGKDNFPADREVADQMLAIAPVAREVVEDNRAFLRRAVEVLTADAGIRQFIDLGSGLPTQGNVHEIAQAAAPEARVVYVDNDPMVVAHSRALLAGDNTVAIEGDLRQPGTVLDHPEVRELIDFGRPVALLLPATLNFVPDDRDPYGIVARLVEAVPSGSYLALTHTSHEIRSERMLEAAERFSKLLGPQYVVRPRDGIVRFFAGLDLIEPGLVQIDRWRPDPAEDADENPRPAPIYGGVGRKP